MHVLARLREIPGATPLRDGLEGGAMRLGDTLFLPYGIADSSVAFAFVPIKELLARLK